MYDDDNAAAAAAAADDDDTATNINNINSNNNNNSCRHDCDSKLMGICRQKLESLAYIFAADSMGLSSFKFLWWAPKDASFLQQSAYRDFVILACVVFTQFQHVTDRQTDIATMASRGLAYTL